MSYFSVYFAVSKEFISHLNTSSFVLCSVHDILNMQTPIPYFKCFKPIRVTLL